MSISSNLTAIKVRDTITANVGQQALIAGGCARDVYFGVEPKDYDIILPEQTNLNGLRTVLESLGVDYREMPFYRYNEAHVNDRIEWCFKFTYSGVDFDILIYRVRDVYDAIKHFDYNINQFVLETIENSDELVATFAGKYHPDKGLVSIRNDASEKRQNYIAAKYSMLYGNLMDI